MGEIPIPSFLIIFEAYIKHLASCLILVFYAKVLTFRYKVERAQEPGSRLQIGHRVMGPDFKFVTHGVFKIKIRLTSFRSPGSSGG